MSKRIAATIRGPKHAPTVEAIGEGDSGFMGAVLEPRPYEQSFTDTPDILREDLGSVSARAEETFRPACPAFITGRCLLTAKSYLGEGPEPELKNALYMTLRCPILAKLGEVCPSIDDGVVIEAVHEAEQPAAI